MMMERSNCETVCQGEALVTVARMEEAGPKGGQVDTREFERLLQRAAEVLKVREQRAAGRTPAIYTADSLMSKVQMPAEVRAQPTSL